MERMTLSVDEMAATLGISRPKAYELVHSDGFPRINVGRRIRIPRTSLERWIETQAANQASGQ